MRIKSKQGMRSDDARSEGLQFSLNDEIVSNCRDGNAYDNLFDRTMKPPGPSRPSGPSAEYNDVFSIGN